MSGRSGMVKYGERSQVSVRQPGQGGLPQLGATADVESWTWGGLTQSFEDVFPSCPPLAGELVGSAVCVGSVRRRRGTSVYYRPRSAWRASTHEIELVRSEQPLRAMPDSTFRPAGDYVEVSRLRASAMAPSSRRRGDVAVDVGALTGADSAADDRGSSTGQRAAIPGASDRFVRDMLFLPKPVREGFIGQAADYADAMCCAHYDGDRIARYAVVGLWLAEPTVRVLRANLHAGAPHWQVEQVTMQIGTGRQAIGFGA